MPKVIVKTGHPHDGEYELDLSRFSWRERAFIADFAGTMPPDFIEKWFGGDPKTVLATIAVMMERANVIPDLDVLMDADDRESITVDYSDLKKEEDGEDPTPRPSEGGEPAESDAA